MQEININNKAISFNEQIIFKDINLTIFEQDKIGLIGNNGSGKTTLMTLIYDHLLLKGAKVSYLKQSIYAQDLDLLVYEYINHSTSEWWLIIDFIRINFLIEITPNILVSSLSGGEILLINFAIENSKDSDFFLLDEPTNHLDIVNIKYLQNYLMKCTKSLIVISHNIDFLNNVVTKIWSIESQQIEIYGGNYDYFALTKQNELNAKQRKYISSLKEIKKVNQKINDEKQSVAQSFKIEQKMKNDKSTDRFTLGNFRNKVQNSNTLNIKKYQQKKESLGNTLNLNKKDIKPKVIFLTSENESSRSSILQITDGLHGFGDKVLIRDINFKLKSGDKLAIIGANGLGKSSFINKMLDGAIPGIKIFNQVRSIYIDQKYKIVDSDKSIYSNIQQYNPGCNDQDIRKQLSNFMFKNASIQASQLSGGEIARLALAKATLTSTHLLILDEPTNNLDIETIEIMSQAICNYTGTLIVISHDLKFISSINLQSVYEIKDQKFNHLNMEQLNSLYERSN